MYGMSPSAFIIKTWNIYKQLWKTEDLEWLRSITLIFTFAVGSLAFKERKAENAAVPPPIIKYGISDGIFPESSGFWQIGPLGPFLVFIFSSDE